MSYLGIDFGLRRVGLAASEGQFSSPLKTIDVKGFRDALEKILKLVQVEQFNKIIIGLPEGKMEKTVLGFINALKKQGLDVVEVDETLSSQRALEQMIKLNIPQKKRKANDAYSAAIILQNWLDNNKKI